MSIVMIFQFVLALETNQTNGAAERGLLSTFEFPMAVQTTLGFVVAAATWTINRGAAGTQA